MKSDDPKTHAFLAARKERLARVREHLGLTQEQVADQAGRPREYYAKVENGHNQLKSYELREALASVFKLTLDDFSKLIDGTITAEDAIAIIDRGTVPSDPGAVEDAYEPRSRAIKIKEMSEEFDPEVATRLRAMHGKHEAEYGVKWWLATWDRVAAELAGTRQRIGGRALDLRKQPPPAGRPKKR